MHLKRAGKQKEVLGKASEHPRIYVWQRQRQLAVVCLSFSLRGGCCLQSAACLSSRPVPGVASVAAALLFRPLPDDAPGGDLFVRLARSAVKSRIFQVIYVGRNCCHQYFWPCWPVDFSRVFIATVAVVFHALTLFLALSQALFLFLLLAQFEFQSEFQLVCMKCVFWPLYVSVVLLLLCQLPGRLLFSMLAPLSWPSAAKCA